MQTADTGRFELGATTTASAWLNRSSYSGGGREAMNGLYGSYWITDRVEIGGRVARLTQPDVFDVLNYNVGVPPARLSVPIGVRHRSQLYILGHVYRHFGPSPRIRFFGGVAVGSYKQQWTDTCEAAGCEETLTRRDPMLRRGRKTRRPPDVAPGLGLEGQASFSGAPESTFTFRTTTR